MALVALSVPAFAQAEPVQGATLYVDSASQGGTCSDRRTVAQVRRTRTPWCSLRRALVKAPAGSTVRLRGGTYRTVRATEVRRSPSRLTFVSHGDERVVVKGVRLARCNNLVFRRLHLQYVRLENCSNSQFIANEVTRGGLWAFFSNNLRFVDNKVHDSNEGFILKKVKRVTIRGNDFRRIPTSSRRTVGGDGIQAGNVVAMTIRNNVFDEFPSHPHTDSIEFEGNNDRVTMDGNIFRQSRGPITVAGPAIGAGRFKNAHWRIENNEFTHMKEWALELNNVPGARIVNNTAWFTGHGIRLHGATSGVVMANNLSDFASADEARMVGRSLGNVFGRVEREYRAGATDVLGMPGFVDRLSQNFQLIPGSLGIDLGSADLAPPRDRLGRPRVGPVDAGAYEYQGP